MKTTDKRLCPVCHTPLPDNSDRCPVCALRGALNSESDASFSKDASSGAELRFAHYKVLENEDGTPIELGRGAMGVTYKAFDVHLRCAVALKIISTQLIGDAAARHRFVREARAAASVRDANVASVFYLGETGSNYFYAMEFVEGETLESFIRRSGRLEPDVAFEVLSQIAAGLAAIHKQHLVHRDIKPSNIMVGFDDGHLENVKIIDLGLAKGAMEQDTISIVGSFTGTPEYASPEQFSGLGADIRSDLYSLGVSLWEMLSGKLPFQGSAIDLMYQHQHAAPPTEKLTSVPAPMVALLEILLAKEPGQRFQTPAELKKALPRVKEALAAGSHLTVGELRSLDDEKIRRLAGPLATCRCPKSTRPTSYWALAVALCTAGLLAGWLFLSSHCSTSHTENERDMMMMRDTWR